jgi:hypothetical protein
LDISRLKLSLILGVHYPAGHVAEAYALLTRAVDEGYGGALRVDRSNLDAKLGVADVFLLAGKLKVKDGEVQASQENFGRSAATYREALEGKLTGLGFAEWCDAVYNYACAGRLLLLFLVRLLYYGNLMERENVQKVACIRPFPTHLDVKRALVRCSVQV